MAKKSTISLSLSPLNNNHTERLLLEYIKTAPRFFKRQSSSDGRKLKVAS